MQEFEPECTLLGNMFQSIVLDLKGNSTLWEELVNRGSKLQQTLRTCLAALSTFNESLQKIADSITSTKGSTKEIGSTLTRICVRQRHVEGKLKLYVIGLQDYLVQPIGERLEEWKKCSGSLEKEHSKDIKKYASEIKKRSTEVYKLKKKIKKGTKCDNFQQQLTQMSVEVADRITHLEEVERSCLRNILVEERTRACFYALSLSKLLNLQVEFANEASTVEELSNDLRELCRNPKQLPTKVDDIIQDYTKGAIRNNINPLQQQDSFPVSSITSKKINFHSPPSSPISNTASSASRCSLSSIPGSNDSTLSRTSSFQHSKRLQKTNSSSSQREVQCNPGLDESSVLRGLDVISSRPMSWKDWSKPGPYELINQSATIDDRRLPPTGSNPNQPPLLSPKPASMLQSTNLFKFPASSKEQDLPGGSSTSVDSVSTNTTLKADEMEQAIKDMLDSPLPPPPPEMLNQSSVQSAPPLPPRNENHLVSGDFSSATLGRKMFGSHYSSSSGYSSQNTTPACSQDTIASHETDLGSIEGEEMTSSDHDHFSTMPRIRFQGGTLSRRPISTSGSYLQHNNQTATIRRKPTGKYNSIRRIPSGLKAVNTPTVPSSKPPIHDSFVQVFAPSENINNSGNQMINNCDKSNLQFSFLTQQFKQSVHLPNDDDSTSDIKPIGPW